LRPIATTQGGNTANCYLIWDESTKEAALFDTGWEADPILALVADNRLDLKRLFITHRHLDHIAALDTLRARFPHIGLHSSSRQAQAGQRNRPGEIVRVGCLQITACETPGHSEDSATYVIKNFPQDAPTVAMVGDALFAGSLGRGFQSTELLKRNVKEFILSLPPSTLLCPGHGPLTTVSEERAHNPFFPE
jgi:glyoxylase-like metal-dependent hydrolase (beta-lactamase superfamily II)